MVMTKSEYFETTRETLISELLEVEKRLALIRKRVKNIEEIGVGDSVFRSIGKIYYLLGKYSELYKNYEQ